MLSRLPSDALEYQLPDLAGFITSAVSAANTAASFEYPQFSGTPSLP